MIGLNWGIYLYAINSNQVIESSLGYFINPLINMLLGTLILKEHLSKVRKIAVGLAGVGVLWLTFLAGHFPWIGLSLGLTFGFYGLIRKMAEIPMTTALQVESFLLSFAMAALFFWQYPQASLSGQNSHEWLLLIGAGLATGIPLYWFSKATKLAPLNVLGFLQFISPTLQFLLGVFLYKEPFPREEMMGFAFIWLGVLVLILELLYNRRSKFTKEELQKI